MSRNFSTLQNRHLIKLFAISARFMPKIAPFKKMFSRRSVQDETLYNLKQASTRPYSSLSLVGCVICERILSSVDLPPPLRPIIPAHPGHHLELTSRSAHT